ncbi:TPA: hypothetical protein ACT5CR_005463 [Burkholderia cenocepacia]|uniref:hypothetical protein n=1 Tax=Burkholderia cepacia complex TaxID=87882 RepID=UPI001CF52638|nr:MULTISPECIES: hypothetical protein [Burkholderia cepacia complex]MCA8082065.1 hypothetical protein [Burkholderia cepacia]MEB2603456.1 hypothetical protein [Burkholderia cenocepacia]
MSKSGKFQIPPRAPVGAPVEASASGPTPAATTSAVPLAIDPVARIAATQQFVDGASMVQSQAPDYPVKPKRLNVDLDPQTHKKLKVAAAAANVAMADLIRMWISEKLG